MGLNIKRSRDLIQITTVWLAPKQEYSESITNMDPQWEGETVIAEEKDEAFSRLGNALWAFKRSLDRQWYKLKNKAAFQAELYENIDPETAKAVIAATRCPNCDMHKISI